MVSIERSELGLRDEHTEKADYDPTNGHNPRSTRIKTILKETVTGCQCTYTDKIVSLGKIYVRRYPSHHALVKKNAVSISL